MKLCQIIAVVSGQKTDAANTLTDAHNRQLKPALLDGFERSYKPKKDPASGGEELPPESKKVQITVPTVINEVYTKLATMFDAVLTLDKGNCIAKTDIVIDGHMIIKDCPSIYMVFLDKQLTDLETFASQLPVVSSEETWLEDPDIGGFKTAPSQSLKTAKVLETHVAYAATEHHPAQTQTNSVDRAIGTWTTIKKTGAIRLQERNNIVERIQTLKIAVRMARETANSTEIEQAKASKNILDYVFKGAFPPK